MAPNEYGKTIVLQMIKEKKDILFESIPHPLTNDDRHREWQTIHEKAKSLGLVKESESWEHMRDTTWANWKRRTLEKKDKKGKTGKEGGRVMQYSSIDNLVLDIVGRDSATSPLIEVQETLENHYAPVNSSTPCNKKSTKRRMRGN